MTVVRPNSISGITSITAQTDTINFFKSDGSLAGLLLNGTNFNTTSGVSTFNALNVGVTTISVNSSSDALRITQLGTGNALVVEDETNPDTSPFVVDASGKVGLGISLPLFRLDVDGVFDVSPARFLRRGTFGEVLRIGRFGQSESASIHYPTDGTFAINTTDGERFRIDSNGNVGIGTSTGITSKLQVQGDVRVVGVITATSDVKIGTKSVATTGKAIAMAMVFS